MQVNKTKLAFIKSICNFVDGTTVKFVKGDKVLIEVDGSVITGVLDILDKHEEFITDLDEDYM